MSGKKILLAALLLVAIIFPRCTRAAGVTIITHGFDSNATNDWIVPMAGYVPPYFTNRNPGFGTNFTIYTIVLGTGGSYHVSRAGNAPSNNPAGEILVELDWSQLSGSPTDIFNPANNDTSTTIVAATTAGILSQTNSIADLNGHALAEFPLHLIGHSRGGSLVNELSHDLGTNGIWVDHLTTLDPHPVNNDGFNQSGFFPTDATAKVTYATVLYHDNYWQNIGTGFDFDGESVPGAYNRQLTTLSGGYNNSSGELAPNHSNVHLWYFGTMDTNTPASYNIGGDTASVTSSERGAWWVPYENAGVTAGFLYSLIGGANRLSTDHPLGLPSNPAIVDGFNQWWDLGAGVSSNRTALTTNSGVWPNMIRFNVTGTNVVTSGQSVSVGFYYQYGGPSTNLTAQFYFGGDFNALNTNRTLTTQLPLAVSGVNSVYFSAASVFTTGLPAGTYSVCAKISDGVRSRYMYAPQLVQVVVPPPIVLAITNGTPGLGFVTIGSAPGQATILQSSTDLTNWTPIKTNSSPGGAWSYPINFTNGPNQQFFRAVAP
jgi:hypothetical protein